MLEQGLYTKLYSTTINRQQGLSQSGQFLFVHIRYVLFSEITIYFHLDRNSTRTFCSVEKTPYGRFWKVKWESGATGTQQEAIFFNSFRRKQQWIIQGKLNLKLATSWEKGQARDVKCPFPWTEPEIENLFTRHEKNNIKSRSIIKTRRHSIDNRNKTQRTFQNGNTQSISLRKYQSQK